MATETTLIKYVEGAAASTPAATRVVTYAKADGLMYSKDDAGAETLMSGGSAGTPDHGLCQGRLTLTTGTPVTTADVTAATNLYFTPYRGSRISTYSGAAWSTSTFTEKTLSLAGLTADSNYDIFIVDSTLALEALVWTNDTTRATALVLQDGVYVKSGATTRRYLGTIRITGTIGQTEDSLAKRFVWNYYSQMERPLKVSDVTNSWTYATATWRAANNTTTDHVVSYVCGLSEAIVRARLVAGANPAATAGAVGIGVDSTTANSGTLLGVYSVDSAVIPLISAYEGWPGIGYHYLAWIEYARVGTLTFYGDANQADLLSTLSAAVLG